MALFSSDTHFVVYMNAKDPTPSQELHSREALSPVFADLNKYDATTHFVGQSTIFTLTGDRATGEAYCLAHHVTVNSGKWRLMLASPRHVREDGRRVAVCRAAPLRRLAGGAGAVMSVPGAGGRHVLSSWARRAGGYALRYGLDHAAVGRMTAISRRALGISHPKLDEVLHR